MFTGHSYSSDLEQSSDSTQKL